LAVALDELLIECGLPKRITAPQNSRGLPGSPVLPAPQDFHGDGPNHATSPPFHPISIQERIKHTLSLYVNYLSLFFFKSLRFWNEQFTADFSNSEPTSTNSPVSESQVK